MQLPRNAIVYFSVVVDTAWLEEAASEGDTDAIALASNGRELACMEGRAAAWIARECGMERWGNEGHDAYGDLVCKFGVSDLAEIERIERFISRNFIGGNDQIYTPERFIEARDFRLYPFGVNDVFFGAEHGAEGDLSDFIDAYRKGEIVAA